MIRPVYLYGSEVLREVAAPADLNRKEEVQSLIADLKETLAVCDGCGLAAPQIGVSLRVAIVDGDVMKDVFPELAGFRRTFVNPVITFSGEEECSYNEGCLSVPGVYADVWRPEVIEVDYLDENFERKHERFDGFAARMVQHEFSHLDGVMFTDLVAPIRRKLIARKLQNIAHGKVGAAYKTVIK